MMLCFVLVWRLALKLGGKSAALIAGGLLLTNLFLVHYYTTFCYRVMEAFFMLVFFNILSGGLRDSIKYPLATFMLCLVVGIRYPVDIVSVLLVLYLIYVIYRNWHHKRVILISLAVAVLSLGALLLPFIILAKDQFFFDTFTFNLKLSSFNIESGIGEGLNIWNRLYAKLVDLAMVFHNFQAVVSILVGLLLYLLYSVLRSKTTKIAIKEAISKNQSLVFLLVFIVSYEVFCAVAIAEPAAILRSLTFPAAAVLAGVGLSKVLADIKDNSATWLLYGLVTALIVITPFAQFVQGGGLPALKWKSADVKYVLDVADRVASYTSEGNSVLTFTPSFVFQADRKLMPGTLMELFNFFPTWETAKAQKYHLLNLDMLLDYLTSRKAGAVVLTEFRFYSGKGQGKILDKYRTDIIRVLEENYYLAETVPYPPEIGIGNVYIYLPRSP
jgi:hypothetical protein